MMNRVVAFALIVASSVTASQAQDTPKIVWQYALSDVVPNTVYMDYAEKIIPDRVKKATGGRLEIIPHRSAVKSADVLDAVRDRRFDMGVQGANHRADTALYDFAAVPGLTSYDALKPVHAELSAIFAREMKSNFDLEFLGFGYWPRQMVLSNRKIEKYEDFSGSKLRASSVAIQKTLAAIGATPVAIPFADTYIGIQKGTIDGAVSGAVAFSAAKWFENAKFSSQWPLGSANYLFIVNKDAWAELPADMREIVKKVVYDAALETWQGALDEEKVALQTLKSSGVEHTVAKDAEMEKVSAKSAPLIKAWADQTGAAGAEVRKLVSKN